LNTPHARQQLQAEQHQHVQQLTTNNSSPGVQRSGITDNSSMEKGELEENEQAPIGGRMKINCFFSTGLRRQ
jgi:hypothetical protein